MEPAKPRPRLLLVGGRPLLLKALERGLREEGFAIDVVESERGAEKVLAFPYRAIILDVALHEELASVRSWRGLGVRSRVIALTPWPAPPGVQGVDEVFLKPFLFEALLDRLMTPGVTETCSCNGDFQ